MTHAGAGDEASPTSWTAFLCAIVSLSRQFVRQFRSTDLLWMLAFILLAGIGCGD
jgi:hypothetical protein